MNNEKKYEVVYGSVLKFVKVGVYSALSVLLIGTISFWFFYEVKGKPLSTHTSEIGVKLVEQLVEDGYFAGAKVMFTEKEYCTQHGAAHKNRDNCITEKDRESLDRLIDRALFFGGPDGIKK